MITAIKIAVAVVLGLSGLFGFLNINEWAWDRMDLTTTQVALILTASIVLCTISGGIILGMMGIQ